MALDVYTLREIFRNYRQWEALVETDRVDTIKGPDGEEYDFYDIQYLYEHLGDLPARQQEAIELYLINNMREKDAAVRMGLSETNPIGIYATVGLTKLLELVRSGALPRFKMSRS